MRNSRFKPDYLVMAFALIAIVIGAYITFFESEGFKKTKAVIVSVKEVSDPSASNRISHRAEVEYEIDGKTCRQFLDAWSPGCKVGKTIDIAYDPADPMKIRGGSWMGIYFMAVGGAVFFGTLIVLIRKKKR
ncbi:MAG: DUF3592 domain-containing protein [Lachnospiraceae bacterium]|nr:DUF3592 domain-containing protein [Lachnospiraceae bacterium]